MYKAFAKVGYPFVERVFAKGCQPFIDTNYLQTLCKGWQPIISFSNISSITFLTSNKLLPGSALMLFCDR